MSNFLNYYISGLVGFNLAFALTDYQCTYNVKRSFEVNKLNKEKNKLEKENKTLKCKY